MKIEVDIDIRKFQKKSKIMIKHLQAMNDELDQVKGGCPNCHPEIPGYVKGAKDGYVDWVKCGECSEPEET